jgi:hypothetical protein
MVAPTDEASHADGGQPSADAQRGRCAGGQLGPCNGGLLVDAAGNTSGAGWRYVHNDHLLSSDQQAALVNFPGEISQRAAHDRRPVAVGRSERPTSKVSEDARSTAQMPRVRGCCS